MIAVCLCRSGSREENYLSEIALIASGNIHRLTVYFVLLKSDDFNIRICFHNKYHVKIVIHSSQEQLFLYCMLDKAVDADACIKTHEECHGVALPLYCYRTNVKARKREPALGPDQFTPCHRWLMTLSYEPVSWPNNHNFICLLIDWASNQVVWYSRHSSAFKRVVGVLAMSLIWARAEPLSQKSSVQILKYN